MFILLILFNVVLCEENKYNDLCSEIYSHGHQCCTIAL